ncbi:acyltransferase family protein [Ruegeria atlantica]|uniref:acyltransferase family protein n=1 Tax=Ruegeria atlantica TaxID=81569 RepID=UPI00147DDCA6|nr:acyltransferase [Ruegeria atlantica]
MTRGVSIWLDVLRALATLVVVLSHWAYPRFTDSKYIFLRDWNVGSDAVIVFFVISGCVIAYAADRDAEPGRFAFNRLTRLWSVMLPALVLTLIFDAIGSRHDPAAYPPMFFQPLPVDEFLLRGLSFSNEWGLFGRLRLGSNGPLWSLSYEAAYYFLFGVAFFLRGSNRLSVLALGMMVFGLDILLLMPAWLFGVGFWHWLKSEGPMRVSYAMGVALAVLGPLAYIACQFGGVPEVLSSATAATLNVDDARFVLGFSDEFIWNNMIGVFTVCHLMGVSVIFTGQGARFRLLNWIAGASFSIYVVHYPTLQLLNTFIPEIPGRDIFLLLGSLAVGLLFASVFERPIGKIRRKVKLLWQNSVAENVKDQ